MAEERSGETIEFHQQLKQAKQNLALRFVTVLNAEFVSDVRSLNFAAPPRRNGKPSAVLSSQSTVDSMEVEEIESPSSPTSTKATSPSDSSRRLNRITEVLLQFEEKCLMDRLITELQMRSLRSLNRGLVSLVLERPKMFKDQPSFIIALTILMFNSFRIKLPKNAFRDLISELFPKFGSKEQTVQNIKQSKAYSLIKCLLQSN